VNDHQVIIRAAAATDAETITSFNAAMARETEYLELDRERLRAGVKALLDNHSLGFYLVAEMGGAVVGQLMITYEWSDWRNGTFWWIQSVYVRPEDRGRGVFRQLYDAAEKMARASGGSCGLRLYVEGENERAQQVYERMGMRPTSYRLFETDFVMRR